MVFVVCCLLCVVWVSWRGLRCLSSLLNCVVCCCLLCCCGLSCVVLCVYAHAHYSFVICCLLCVVWCKFLVVELCSLYVVRCGVCVVCLMLFVVV